MGFFRSRDRSPQTPLPNISLNFSHSPETVLRPNDAVSGTVTISTPIPINPEAIEVSLWGESKTWVRTESTSSNTDNSSTITSYTHYRDNAPLFTVTLNLLEKTQIHLDPGQTYSYPFNFRMPQGTSFNRSDCYKDSKDERWTCQPHNLPPTFFFGHDPKRPDIPDTASITYGVTGRLICPGLDIGKQHDALSASKEFIFQPLNPHPHLLLPNASFGVVRYPKTFTLQSSTLTGQDPHSIGFRQRMHDRFSSGTPKLDFELGIEIPDLLTTGSEFRFRTTFAVVAKSHNAVHIPPITFEIRKLELLDFTFFRANWDRQAMNNMSGDHFKSKHEPPKVNKKTLEWIINREQKTLLNAIPPSHTTDLKEYDLSSGEEKEEKMEQADKYEYWFTARVPGTLPPSFKSFAISRAYRVRAKVRVEIGDKKFDYEAESHIRELGSA